MGSVDMEGNNQPQRKPLQLISIKNGSLEWNCETWNILQGQIPEKNQVAIVGIAGSPKSGKSLLANYIIEYLENHQNPGHHWLKTWEHTNDPKYLEQIGKGEDPFEVFPVAVRGPVDSDLGKTFSPGVYCWVIQPPVQKGDSQNLSILVLDIQSPCQGDLSRPNIYGTLIDFVFLASSLVVYLDKMENWTCKNDKGQQLWSPASSFVKQFPDEYFQSCHFILREWNEPKSFLYGSSGGTKFLSFHGKDEKSLFHVKSHEIQSFLHPRFSNFTFHLLPKSKAEFSRILKEGSKEYIKYLKSFVEKEIDVEEIFPVKFENENDKTVTMATFEKFLRYPMNVIHVPSYETDIDLPPDDEMDVDDDENEKNNESVNPPAPVGNKTAKTPVDSPQTDILESSSLTPLLTAVVQLEPENVQNKTPKLYPTDVFDPPKQGPEPMDVDSVPVERQQQQHEEPGVPAAMEQTKTSEEKAVLDMMEKEFKVPLEILQSSKYFFYPNVKEEMEKIKTNLKGFFPTFLTPENTNLKVETEFRKNSTAMRKFDNENRQRRMEAQGQIEQLFESLWKSEFQRLKQTGQKNIPEPFLWVIDLDTLHRHFDAFLKGLVTPSSPAYDQEFQKECQDTCKQKIEQIRTITNYSSAVVNEYSRQMKIELQNAICIDTESDFDQLHKTILSSALKSCSNNPTNDVQKNAGSSLDDLTNSMILDYERKFREDNNEIRKEEAQIAQQAMDFALQKYTQYMDEETSQGSGVFKTSEIHNFHTVAYENLKMCFISVSNFKFTYGWTKSWEKLDKKLKELEKDYQGKNTQRIEKNKLQRKISFSAAENEYKKLMNGFISTQGRGKSLGQDKLEKCHKDAVKAALKLYADKMKGVKEDTKIIEESLASKFVEERKKLVMENDEKVARELKEEEEAKVKEEEQKKISKEREAQIKREIELARENEQKEQLVCNVTPPIIIEEDGQNNQVKANQNFPLFQGGIAIHFHHSGLHVVSYKQDTGFTTICRNFSPCIAFTKQDIFIGDEASSLRPHGQPSVEFKTFDLFDLLQSEKYEARRLTVHNNDTVLRTEEILAIFLCKLSLLITNIHPDFHPSSSCVEFVISPFLHLPVKQLIRNALTLAGFSRAHILQSTSAMALTYYYRHRNNLQQNEGSHNIVAIHSAPSTFDVVVSRVSGQYVTSRRQTGLPYCEKLGTFQGIVTSAGEIFGGLSGHEKGLRGMLKSVLKECKLEPKDIHHHILPVARGRKAQEVLHNVLNEVFKLTIQISDEREGILDGAAVFAAGKAGLPIFSKRFELEEIQPYFLTAVFAKNGGGDVKYPLIRRHDPCVQELQVQSYAVTQEVSKNRNTIWLEENNKRSNWCVGEFEAGNGDKKGTIVRTQLEFHISPEGLIDVRWPPGSPWAHQLPFRSKCLWLDSHLMESAAKNLAKILSSMTGSIASSKLESQTPGPSLCFSQGSVVISATVLTNRVEDSTDGRPSSQSHKPPSHVPVDTSGGRELEKERKKLESLAAEVKNRLDNSPSTSELVRGPIEELLQEIKGVLHQTSRVEAELLKSYAKKLEIRAKRIK